MLKYAYMSPENNKRSTSEHEHRPLLQWFLDYAQIKRKKAQVLNRRFVSVMQDFNQSLTEQYITHRTEDNLVPESYDQVNLAPPSRTPAFDDLSLIALKFPRTLRLVDELARDPDKRYERYDDVFVEAQFNDGVREQYLINKYGLTRYNTREDIQPNRRLDDVEGTPSRYAVVKRADSGTPRLSLELLYEIMYNDTYDYVRQTLTRANETDFPFD